LYPEDATWKNLDTLLKDYPTLLLENKVFVEEEGDVMAQEKATEDHDETSMSNPIAKSRPKRQSAKPKFFSLFCHFVLMSGSCCFVLVKSSFK